MKSILMILPVLFMISCASKKNGTTNAAVQSKTPQAMNDTTGITVADTLPLIVEFYSIGSGINHESKIKLDSAISNHEKISKQSISYQTIHWGREGELDACFRLSNLNGEQRQAFIAELKKIFDDKSMVHILENQNCRHIR